MTNASVPESVSLKYRVRLCLAFVLFCLSSAGHATEPLKLVSSSQLSGMTYLADNPTLYRQYGLKIELTPVSTGEAALRTLLDGRSDLALVSGVQFVKHAMRHGQLRLIADMGQADNQIRLAVRGDQDIMGPESLTGKRIGTQPGIEFRLFLDRVLSQQGLSEQDVTPVFLPANRLPAALTNGLIDAMVSRDPYLGQPPGQQPDIRIIDTPTNHLDPVVLVTTDDFLQTDRAKTLTHLVQALRVSKRQLHEQSGELSARPSQLPETIDDGRSLLERRSVQLTDTQLLASLQDIARRLQQLNGESKPAFDLMAYMHTPLLARVKSGGADLLP